MARKRPQGKQSTGSKTVRIIGGRWRGRKLPVATVRGLRPSGDRVRETLFNWLQPVIKDAHVLDLFSGTGALGLEALSRGAANALLVESDPRAAAAIASALDLLQVEKARLLQVDAISLLNSAEVKQFDVVFIDPPFETGLWEQVVSLLVEKNWLAEDCLVYLEYPSDQQPNLPVSLHWHRQAQAGAVGYGLAVHGPAN